MEDWINWAQKFIISGFTDQDSLHSAISFCENENIRVFLELIQIDNHEFIPQGTELSNQLETKGKEKESIIISLLSNISFLNAIEKPLQFPIEFRNSAYIFSGEMKTRLQALSKLEPTAAFISSISAAGFVQTLDFIAAQDAFKEALEIRRNLAGKEPEVYRPAIAVTLGNLGILQSQLHDFFEAKKSYEESLEIKRELELMPDVAITLNNLGNLLRKLREFTAAREAYEESLEIRRELVHEEMELHKPGIAQTLNNLGNLLFNLRDFSTARKTYEKANRIYRELELKDSKYRYQVSMTLDNLGVLLRNLRDFTAARKASEEALEIQREFAIKDPGSYRPGIALTLNNLGILLRHLRDFPAAQKAFEESIDIKREFAIKDPDAYRPGIALVLNNLGNLLGDESDIQDFSARRMAYEEARDIYLELAQKEPEFYRTYVAGILNNLGNLMRDLQDYPAAQKSYEDAIRIAEIMPDNKSPIHLVKGPILESYRQVLHAKATNSISAFALTAATRNRITRFHDIGKDDLDELQALLKSREKKTNILNFLLLPTSGHDKALTLGLVSAEDATFYTLDASNWNEILPLDVANTDHTKQKSLARLIWGKLPREVQQTLRPSIDIKKYIIIGGDPFWTAFPWELLRFGEGEEDYLGLHYVLPRIGSILSTDIDAQLGVKAIGTGQGKVSIIAPHDTGLSPLQGVVEEIEAIKLQVENLHGQIITFAKGTQASELALVKAINEQPDILYYTGHGTIIQSEELLVLNTDLSVKNPLSATTYFGNQQLNLLAKGKNKSLFTNSPLIVLNCCNTGRTRNHGGAREDLVSIFLSHGAGAVIATALPINDAVGKEFSEALFSPTIANMNSIGDQVLEARRSLANGLCRDVKKPFWGAWSMIHIHGSSDAAVPFRKQ